MLTGTCMRSIVRPTAASAWLSETRSGRLNEIEVEAETPVWLTLTGVEPVAKWLNAENGTIVSRAMLTADPVEVLPRPAFASEFAAAFLATSCAAVLAVDAPAEPAAA